MSGIALPCPDTPRARLIAVRVLEFFSLLAASSALIDLRRRYVDSRFTWTFLVSDHGVQKAVFVEITRIERPWAPFVVFWSFVFMCVFVDCGVRRRYWLVFAVLAVPLQCVLCDDETSRFC